MSSAHAMRAAIDNDPNYAWAKGMLAGAFGDAMDKLATQLRGFAQDALLLGIGKCCSSGVVSRT